MRYTQQLAFAMRNAIPAFTRKPKSGITLSGIYVANQKCKVDNPGPVMSFPVPPTCNR